MVCLMWHPFHIVTILCIYFVLPIFADLQRLQHQLKHNRSLNFLVIGDWGRKGLYNQSLVATQMGRMGEKLDIDFVVSTGDNFYNRGIKGIHDPTFQQSFSNIYTAKSLKKHWYSVLGNHDYRGNALAQLSPILRKIDKRWFCHRSFILNAGTIEIFFIDTTPFINKYFKNTNHHYDWRGVSPRKSYLKKFQKDLEEALMKSTARWKIVVGHHAIRSIGHHGDSPELVKHLIPILKALTNNMNMLCIALKANFIKANHVDMYINGHDHCLQHIASKDSPLLYVTSGAGSKAWRGDIKKGHPDVVKFFYDGQGFMSAQITETDANFAFYNVFGENIHHWKLTKSMVHTSI